MLQHLWPAHNVTVCFWQALLAFEDEEAQDQAEAQHPGAAGQQPAPAVPQQPPQAAEPPPAEPAAHIVIEIELQPLLSEAERTQLRAARHERQAEARAAHQQREARAHARRLAKHARNAARRQQQQAAAHEVQAARQAARQAALEQPALEQRAAGRREGERAAGALLRSLHRQEDGAWEEETRQRAAKEREEAAKACARAFAPTPCTC